MISTKTGATLTFPDFDDIKVSTKTFTATTNLNIQIDLLFKNLPITSYIVTPKKRGRKPNRPAATQPTPTQPQVDKGGRPPLARPALVDDTAPTLRRSNRNKK